MKPTSAQSVIATPFVLVRPPPPAAGTLPALPHPHDFSAESRQAAVASEPPPKGRTVLPLPRAPGRRTPRLKSADRTLLFEASRPHPGQESSPDAQVFHPGELHPGELDKVSAPEIRCQHPGAASTPAASAASGTVSRSGGGVLLFDCPQCGGERAVPAWMAGMKMRMPCCGAAIRAADPEHRGRARSMERDVESVLHPERFLAPAELARKFRATGFCIAAAVTGILLGGWQGLALADQPLTGKFSASPRQAVLALPPAASLSSEAVVRKFLEADGAAAKAAFVKSPEQIQPLMESYFKKFGGGRASEVASITCSSPGISVEFPSGPPVIHAVADLRDGSRQYFTLEETGSGPLIDWTTSTGWSGVEFTDLLVRPGVSRRMHVLAHEDDFFPAPAGESSDLCLRIVDPRTGLPAGYAYAPRQSEGAVHLQRALTGSRRLVRLTLTLESDPALAPHRAVRVRAFHHTGFRAPESPAL